MATLSSGNTLSLNNLATATDNGTEPLGTIVVEQVHLFQCH